MDLWDLPVTAMPSRHQEIFAGGLLELESQISVASIPGFNSGGSIVIFTVSGATVEQGKYMMVVSGGVREVNYMGFKCCSGFSRHGTIPRTA